MLIAEVATCLATNFSELQRDRSSTQILPLDFLQSELRVLNALEFKNA